MGGDEDPGAADRPPGPVRRRSHRGEGKGRLEAFSDGVIAIAITLLVLDLAIPDSAASRQDLWHAVLEEWPGYLGYVVSFSTVGALWLGHSAITGYMDRVDQNFLRLNLVFLFFVCLMPFVTRLLSEFIDVPGAERVASTVYGVTLLVCATLIWVLWRYALAAGLVTSDADDVEIALLTDRVTPSLGGYIALILLGFWLPVAAVIGYLVVAVFLILPFRVPRQLRSRPRRARRSESP